MKVGKGFEVLGFYDNPMSARAALDQWVEYRQRRDGRGVAQPTECGSVILRAEIEQHLRESSDIRGA